jgi:hypothetical protein
VVIDAEKVGVRAGSPSLGLDHALPYTVKLLKRHLSSNKAVCGPVDRWPVGGGIVVIDYLVCSPWACRDRKIRYHPDPIREVRMLAQPELGCVSQL